LLVLNPGKKQSDFLFFSNGQMEVVNVPFVLLYKEEHFVTSMKMSKPEK